jgi:hypothetical protein
VSINDTPKPFVVELPLGNLWPIGHFTPTGSSWLNQVERWFGFLGPAPAPQRPQKRRSPGE